MHYGKCLIWQIINPSQKCYGVDAISIIPLWWQNCHRSSWDLSKHNCSTVVKPGIWLQGLYFKVFLLMRIAYVGTMNLYNHIYFQFAPPNSFIDSTICFPHNFMSLFFSQSNLASADICTRAWNYPLEYENSTILKRELFFLPQKLPPAHRYSEEVMVRDGLLHLCRDFSLLDLTQALSR